MAPRHGTFRAGQEEATKQQGPVDWTIRGAEEPGMHAPGARTGASGEDHGSKQPGHPDWNIRGAAD